MIICAKTGQIRVNTAIDNREIKRVTDICYFGSTVSENGGATLDKVWQSTLTNRDKKI
jgi:hypothetical protein